MSQGVHEGAVRFIPGGLNPNEAAKQAMRFNNKPIAVAEANHPGTLPPSDGFLRVTGSHTVVTAIKQAEDNEDTVIRLVEYDGREDAVSVSLRGTGGYDTVMKPYEIKTVRFAQTGITEIDLLERDMKLYLT
jgi:alpha-mannosidase